MPLRTFILHNLWLKIFSLILATLIWFAIQSNQTEGRFSQSLLSPQVQTLALPCPVRVFASPTNRAVLNIDPASVLVRIKGEDAVLKKVSPDTIQAYIRLGDLPNFNRLFHVEVIVPRNVTLMEVVPEEVLVQSITSTNK